MAALRLHMAALTTPLAPSGVDGARSMSFRSISTRVPVAGARVLPRKANVAVRAEGSSIREQAGRRGTFFLQPPLGTRDTSPGPQNPPLKNPPRTIGLDWQSKNTLSKHPSDAASPQFVYHSPPREELPVQRQVRSLRRRQQRGVLSGRSDLPVPVRWAS